MLSVLICITTCIILITVTEAVVVATQPSYRTTATHQNTHSLCAANQLRMPSSHNDRDVDDVMEYFNHHKPANPIYVWCYERHGSKCKAVEIDPSLRVMEPVITARDCDEINHSICLNVPREGPE